jgi:hypothetical protein
MEVEDWLKRQRILQRTSFDTNLPESLIWPFDTVNRVEMCDSVNACPHRSLRK